MENKELLLEYNSKRTDLSIPEYGRHVQKLIRHAQKIEDPAFKQAFVERIIDLMHQMNPHHKAVIEYREKLWKHLFRIANYDLEGVVPPDGEIPKPDEAHNKPSPVPYPKTSFKYRHYGSFIQRMIEKAVKMEDGDIKDEYIQTIGYYMKLAYKNWNRDHYVNDEIIKADLVAISKGEIEIPEGFSLDHVKNFAKSYSRTNNNRKGSRYKRNKKGRSSSNRSRRK